MLKDGAEADILTAEVRELVDWGCALAVDITCCSCLIALFEVSTFAFNTCAIAVSTCPYGYLYIPELIVR